MYTISLVTNSPKFTIYIPFKKEFNFRKDFPTNRPLYKLVETLHALLDFRIW